MAAPRLHLSSVASRAGASEDEEVEVLRSGVHDDDVENPDQRRQSTRDEQNAETTSGSRRKKRSNIQPLVASSGDHDLGEEQSETSTPEADASAAVMASLFSSTTSEAVPDHQEAMDRLQDRTSANNGNGSNVARPSRLSSGSRNTGGQSGPFHSTPDDSTRGTTATVVQPAGEQCWTADETRRALRFFFMNPLEKYRETRRFPWKLALQVVKIFIVTAQLIVFGDLRMGHATFSTKSETALRHLFLANWTSDRDLLIYPPTVPQFSIYEMGDFYTHMTYAIKKYYVLPNVAVATLVYDCHDGEDKNDYADQFGDHCTPPPMQFCVVLLQAAESHLANRTYHYDMRTVTHCIDVDLRQDQWNSTNYTVRDILADHNITLHRQKLVQASLGFKLKTIHLKRLQPADEPDCFRLNVNILYDNSGHTGDILVSLDSVESYMDCEGSVQFPTYNVAMAVLVATLDAVVFGICAVSLILCVRAIIRARQLRIRTNRFFHTYYGNDLTKDDSMKFLNFWYLLIMVNDVCLIVGTIFKLTIEYQHFDSALFTATGMLLGLGTLIVWVGVLRYLAFFPKYNILVITMKRSLPNVLRFMACAGLLYAGFVFCGWVVLGPYHMKFRTILMTSECLFALLNGDDMFATFATTSNASPAVLWFARLYLYTFVSLFTYVVLSLFISIIMEAYEVIKDRQQYQTDQSDLDTFIGTTQFAVDTSAATVPVVETPSPSSALASRLRRRISRQRSHADDAQQYVRFENEPDVIRENQNIPAAASPVPRS